MEINKEELISSLDFTEEEYCEKTREGRYNSFDEFLENVISICKENNGTFEDAVFIANDAYLNL